MDFDWIKQHSIGGNTYWLTQYLLPRLPQGGRILDLGCGKALSSILLAQNLAAEVWAIDKHVDVNENSRMLEGFPNLRIVPLQLDARALPFPDGFFDAIVVINSIHYFGTDDKFLPYICRFLRQGGTLAVADICFTREIPRASDAPDFLQADFHYYFQHIHAPVWWENKWERTGLLDGITAETCANSSLLKEKYLQVTADAPDAFTRALLHDQENLLDFFVLVGQKNGLAPFLE